MLLELVDGPSEFLTSICLKEFLQSSVAELPDLFLSLCVLNCWQISVADTVAQCSFSYHFSTLAVLLILEPRMISGLYSITRGESATTDVIKIVDYCWEPGDFWGSHNGYLLGHLVKLLDCSINMCICEFTIEICIEVNYHFLIDNLGRARLDPCQVDPVLSEDIKSTLKYAWLILECDGNTSPILDLPVCLHVTLRMMCDRRLMCTHRSI
jgi:hypothetical protein